MAVYDNPCGSGGWVNYTMTTEAGETRQFCYQHVLQPVSHAQLEERPCYEGDLAGHLVTFWTNDEIECVKQWTS